MTNPFEDPDATYAVLINDERQYSLWPSAIAVPAGWTVVLDASPRQQALDLIDAQWTDMRPASLAAAMDDAR
jgi:MbtH protein